MAKIVRKTAKLFGISAGFDQLAQFGSLALGVPAFSTDPTVIQSLSTWLDGWFSAVIGSNSPAIEDMNSAFFVLSYMICTIMQDGIPEYDSGTTYYTGSFASSSGIIYVSLTDNNTGNPLTDTTNWKIQNLGVRTVNTNTTMLLTDDYVRASGLTAFSQFSLLQSSTVPLWKDITIANVTEGQFTYQILPFAGDTIYNLAALTLSPRESVALRNNGAGWDIL